MELIKKYKQGKLTQADVQKLNNTVLCLMVLIAICSIIWSVSLIMISGDFSNGLISAKLAFHKRDLSAMSNRSREIFFNDLEAIIDEVYMENDEQTETPTVAKAGIFQHKKRKEKKLPHIYMSYPPDVPVIEVEDEQTTLRSKRALTMTEQQDSTTPAISREATLPDKLNELQSTTTTSTSTTTKKPKVKFNPEADRAFLGNMSISTQETYWITDGKVQFFYNFPFISEIVAIIWAAMCFVFQTGTKKTWSLPKPWRIVVPSLIVFTLMFVANLTYTILTNGFLKRLCTDLRSELTKPDAVSCGQAFTLLRPEIRAHSISLDAYLQLIRACYILAMLLWLIALIVMLVRYVLAIDFQLVDVDEYFERSPPVTEVKVQMPYSAVPLSSPQHKPAAAAAPASMQQTKRDRPKSEDDFQSAKSHLSEVNIPLLPLNAQPRSATSPASSSSPVA